LVFGLIVDGQNQYRLFIKKEKMRIFETLSKTNGKKVKRALTIVS